MLTFSDTKSRLQLSVPQNNSGYYVFTKSVNSNFRAFWLAPVTRNILGYSLFKTFPEEEIWVIKMKQSYKQIPRQRRALACWCLLLGRKLFLCWIRNKMIKVKNDHRSKFSNLSNWKEEAWKISGLQRGSNPWPPRWRCVALPTELWSRTLGARSKW